MGFKFHKGMSKVSRIVADLHEDFRDMTDEIDDAVWTELEDQMKRKDIPVWTGDLRRSLTNRDDHQNVHHADYGRFEWGTTAKGGRYNPFPPYIPLVDSAAILAVITRILNSRWRRVTK